MVKGSHHTEESKQKMSDTQKRIGSRPPSRESMPNSEEQKAKIADTLRRIGHKPPPMYGDDNPSKRPEVRKKISDALHFIPIYG